MTTALVHVDVNDIFDMRPIRLPGFELRGRSVVVKGKPPIKDWQAAMLYASGAHDSAPYWVGELMAYADGRDDYKEKLDQAMRVTKLSRGRLQNLASLVRRVEEPERQLAPTPEHAMTVAPLLRPDQTKWLEQARTEGWSTGELRGRIKAAQRNAVISGQAEQVHQVDVTVSVAIEAQNEGAAEQAAWDLVKAALLAQPKNPAKVQTAKVVEAKVRPR